MERESLERTGERHFHLRDYHLYEEGGKSTEKVLTTGRLEVKYKFGKKEKENFGAAGTWRDFIKGGRLDRGGIVFFGEEWAC